MSSSFERPTRRGFLQSTASVMTLSGLLAACGDSDSAQQAADDQGGTPARRSGIEELRVLGSAHAERLDPTQTSQNNNWMLLIALEPLMLLANDNTLTPNLAESYEQTDPVTHVYRIREGVTFWDGSDLTLDDVVYSLNLHRGEDSQSVIAGQYADVQRIRETGPSEITITMGSPDPQFAYTIALTGIVSKAYHERSGDRIGNPQALNMGTGPYRFESFEAGSRTVLVRNDEYWGEAPRVGRIECATINDDSTRLLALQSGDADAGFELPISQYAAFEALPELELTTTVGQELYKFNFEVDQAPWDDIHVRRAFSHTVDREAIVQGALAGRAQLAPTLVQRDRMTVLLPEDEVDGAFERIGQSYPQFDLEAARRELAQSSVPDGFSVTVPTRADNPNMAAVLQTVAQSAREIGIEIEVEELDPTTFNNVAFFGRETEGLTLEPYGTTGPSAINVPVNAFSSVNASPEGSGINVADYRSPEMDRLLEEAKRLPAESRELGRAILEMLELVAADLPYLPIAYPEIVLGAGSGLAYEGFDDFWWGHRWPENFSRA